MKRKSAVLALAVVILSVTAVQAVPTTYVYTGNPFTLATSPYSTSDFVSGMVTLAGPLAPNFNGFVTPTAFTFSDGVQTLTNFTTNNNAFFFVTGPTAQITNWAILASHMGGNTNLISTANFPPVEVLDIATVPGGGTGVIANQPGVWEIRSAVADTGSTFSMVTLTLMALGVAARQFKRAEV